MVDVIFIFLGLIAIAGAWLIVYGKIDKLRNISGNNFKKERERSTKNDLVAQRLERKFTNVGEKIIIFVSPLGKRLFYGLRGLYRKIVRLERQYNEKSDTQIEKEGQRESTSLKLNTEIDELIEKKEYAIAEKKLIEMISLSPKDPIWYRLLGEVYMQTRQYEQAGETFEYIIALDEKIKNESEIINGTTGVELAGDYVNLAIVYREKGEIEKAVENVEKACRLEANNPRNLDLLFEMSILAGNKVTAWEAHDRLKQVNPENKKLLDMKEKLKNLEENNSILRSSNRS